MELHRLLSDVGLAVEDAEQESFDIFCEELPSGNLGFINPHAAEVDVTVNGRDFAIKQSPAILTSNRAGGTTGAVLWKITPLLAAWLSDYSNFLWRTSILRSNSIVVELGCGIAGLVPLTLGPMVGNCIVTDQEYVHRLLKENLDKNHHCNSTNLAHSDRGSAKTSLRSKQQQKKTQQVRHERTHNITFTPLDWETDHPGNLRKVTIADGNVSSDDGEEDMGFDLLVACDTIYTEALVPAFVRTCAEICRLRPSYGDGSLDPALSDARRKPTLCIVAQHLRSLDVFDVWCRETIRYFHMWRLKDHETDGKLGLGSGFVVHVLVLRDSSPTPPNCSS